MADRTALDYTKPTTGDAIVDGLFSGILAGLVMAAYLVIVGSTYGESPAVVLSRFSLRGEMSPAASVLLHLAISGIYGMLYGLVWQLVRQRWPVARFGGLAGSAYGFVLWIVAANLFLRQTNSPLLDIPPVHFATAHLIYGAILGFLTQRRQKASNNRLD